jgi:hypothetical protein
MEARTMTIQTATTPTTTPPTPAPTWQWPSEVLEFATQQGVQAYLDPLREATRRLFPTARKFEVYVSIDPEIRDLRQIVFRLKVPMQDVPDYVKAVHHWDDEMLRICPTTLILHFCFLLERVSG